MGATVLQMLPQKVCEPHVGARPVVFQGTKYLGATQQELAPAGERCWRRQERSEGEARWGCLRWRQESEG